MRKIKNYQWDQVGIMKYLNSFESFNFSLIDEGIDNNDWKGAIVYHGSEHKFDFDSLDLTRETIKRNNLTGRIHETASEVYGTGLYVTKDLWMDNGDEFYKHIINPVFKEGTKGHESAQKYAQMKSQNAYIYQIELSNDINLQKYGYKNIGGYNIGKSQMKALLDEGVDGLYQNNIEAVILNKDKIKSFKLAYQAEDTMKRVIPVDINKITRGMELFYPGDLFKKAGIEMDYVDIIPDQLEDYLTKIFNGKFITFPNYSTNPFDKKSQVVSNIPEEFLKEFDKPKVDRKYDLSDLSQIKNYKFFIIRNDGMSNWTKVM